MLEPLEIFLEFFPRIAALATRLIAEAIAGGRDPRAELNAWLDAEEGAAQIAEARRFGRG